MSSNIPNNTNTTPIIPLNLVKLIYDDDIVSLINSFSKRIKDFYKTTKQSLQDINTFQTYLTNRNLLMKSTLNDITLNNDNSSLIEPIQSQLDKIIELQSQCDNNIIQMNNYLKSFFEDAKEHFKQMKVARSKKIENIIETNSILNNEHFHKEQFTNIQLHNKYTPIKKSYYKTLSSNYNTPNDHLIHNLHNNNNTNPQNDSSSHRRVMSASSSKKILFSSRSQDKPFLYKRSSLSKERNFKLYKQAQCSLTNNILIFFTELSPFIQSNPKMKSKLDSLRTNIQTQANKIILKDYKNSFNIDHYHYNEISRLKEENKLQSYQLEQSKSQIESLKTKLDIVIQENKDIQNGLSELSQVNISSIEQYKQINILKEEISQLKEEIISKENQIQLLNQQLMNPKLKTSYDELQNNFNLQEIEIKRLTSDNTERAKQNTKLQTEMTTLLKKTKTDKDKIKSLENQINSKNALISKYMKDIDVMQSQRSKNANNFIHQNNILTNKNKEIESLNEEKAINQIIIANLNNELKVHETNTKNAIMSNVKMNNQLNKLNKQLQVQKEEIEKLHVELEFARLNEEKYVEKMKEGLNALNEEKNETIQKMMNENVSLQKDISTERSLRNKKDEIIKSQIDRINEQQNEIEKMKKANAALLQKLQDVNQLNKSNQLQLYNHEIEMKNEEISKLKKEVNKLEKAVQNVNTHNKNEQNLSNEIQSLKMLLQEEKERNKIKESNNKLLATLNEENINKLKELEKQNNNLKTQINDKQNIINNYKAKIEQSTNYKQQQSLNEIVLPQTQTISQPSPENHTIISHHVFKTKDNEFIWYLLKQKQSPHSYNNMIWITEPLIKDNLPKYNSYSIPKEEDNKNLIDFYIKKLEQKENEISKLKNQLNKAGNYIIHQNEASNSLEQNEVKQNKTKISDNKLPFSNDDIDLTVLNKTYVQEIDKKQHDALLEKYNDALIKLNESENQMLKMQNQLKQYKNELLSSSRTFTIEPNENDIQKYKDYVKKIKQEKKIIEEQLSFFKQQYKELEMKIRNITNEIKKLLNIIKLDNTNKDVIHNICNTLGLNEKEIINI